MAQRSIALLLTTLALTVIPAAEAAADGELVFGCWTRPACGKVCKLVCETTTLVSTCYGAECEQICVPGPSRQGCKHCAACCGECEPGLACLPKCLFCWYDWRPCGCTQPRSVKLLTKYEAEKEVCWYHWEVVDACSCGDGACASVYKPAPPDAQIGDTLAVSDEERARVVAWQTAAGEQGAVRPAAAVSTTSHDAPQSSSPRATTGDEAALPLRQKLTGLFRRSPVQP